MRLYNAIILLAITLVIASCSKDEMEEMTLTQGQINRSLVIEVMDRLMLDADSTVINEYYSEDYRQHNPMFPNGRAFIQNVFITNRPPGFTYERGLVIGEGAFVMMHNAYEGFAPQKLVAIDIFKVVDNTIVAHWDLIQDFVPADSSVNGNSMFPIEYTESELETTEDHKSFVLTAIDEAFNNNDVSAIDRYWADEYIQHNPTIPNGREAIKGLLTNFPDVTYEVGYSMQMGDYVFLHSKVTGFAAEPLIVGDIFRIENNKIKEHWDILQTEVPVEESVNGNAMFPIQ